MVLKLACEMAPFGVAEPIQMATLSGVENGTLTAEKLTQGELLEHHDSVAAAIEYFGGYRSMLRGSDGPLSAPPQAPMPEPIPDTPESVMTALVSSPPRAEDDWG